MAENHYAVLRVDPSATQAEIRSSFKALARLHHPDKAQRLSANPQGRSEVPDGCNREHMFSLIARAYEVLGDPTQRAAYDLVRGVRDCSNEEGAFCVVPGTHKSNLPCPYGSNPDEEPGMIGLEVQAGDAILFTEHLRHGGFTNQSDNVRKTLHVGFGPHWMMSQNIATMDEPQHMTKETLARFDEEQRNLFRAWPE